MSTSDILKTNVVLKIVRDSFEKHPLQPIVSQIKKRIHLNNLLCTLPFNNNNDAASLMLLYHCISNKHNCNKNRNTNIEFALWKRLICFIDSCYY